MPGVARIARSPSRRKPEYFYIVVIPKRASARNLLAPAQQQIPRGVASTRNDNS